MRCINCKSDKIVRFIDGFGETRIFCRTCWNSSPERNYREKIEKDNSITNFIKPKVRS